MPYSRKNIKSNEAAYNGISLRDFEKILFDKETGGYLVCHRHHGKGERSQNIVTGTILAKLGHCVELLPALKDTKAPDAIINGDQWEFKMISNAKPRITTAIENHFRRASLSEGQSPNLVLHINQEFMLSSLLLGLQYAIVADEEGYFQKVMLIYKSKAEMLYRREIYFGKAKRKILRLCKN